MAKVALLIGVSDYELNDDNKGFTNLPSAKLDVEGMQRILQNPDIGAFDDVQILLNPNQLQMSTAIETFLGERLKEDLALLYFSGHGAKDSNRKLYFAAHGTRKNTKDELITATAISASFLHEKLAYSRAKKQVVILDCCFSGAFDPNAKGDDGIDIEAVLTAIEGRVILTSSSSTQISRGHPTEMSFYTRYLVKGIEEGEVDKNGNGYVSIQELHNYLSYKLQQEKIEMNPQIIVLKEKGYDIPFAKVPITNPKLHYRKKAERFVKEGHAESGDFDSITQFILNKLQNKLNISNDDAQAITNDILKPIRDHLQNLNEYRKILAGQLENQFPLSDKIRKKLKELQSYLNIDDTEVLTIEQEIIVEFEQKKYRQQHYIKLQKQQEKQDYTKNIQQYEQEFFQAIQREFPLSKETVVRLKQFQEGLKLSDADVQPIRNRIISQKYDAQKSSKVPPLKPDTSKPQNWSDYQDLVSKGFNLIKNFTIDGLEQQLRPQQFWQFLGLNEEGQKKVYQEKLQRYEQELWRIVKMEFPISNITRKVLKVYQHYLGINENDVVLIEEQVTTQLSESKSKNTQQIIDKTKLSTWECKLTLTGHSDRVNTIAINSQGTIVVSGSDDKTIKIWDIQSGDLFRTLEGHSGWVTSISLSADNQILASGSADKKVILWNPITGKRLKTLTGHSDWINAVTISPNRHIIASSSSDKKIQIWHPETGKILRTIKDNSDFIYALVANTNGQILLSSRTDKTIKIWNLSTGGVLNSLAGHSSLIRSLALSSDGNILASGSDDQTIKIWNLNTGTLLNTLTGHSNSVRSVAISANGKILVSGSDDQTIKIWNLKTGELLNTLVGHSANVTSVAINFDGTIIASGSNDKTIKVWC